MARLAGGEETKKKKKEERKEKSERSAIYTGVSPAPPGIVVRMIGPVVEQAGCNVPCIRTVVRAGPISSFVIGRGRASSAERLGLVRDVTTLLRSSARIASSGVAQL